MADGEALATDAGLPWPRGDVASLQGAASRLLVAANDMGNVGSEVGDLAAGSVGWTGAAAGRFDASTTAEGATLIDASDGLGDASQALRTLADVVLDAQERVAGLARQVLELEDRAVQAAQIAAWTTPDRPDSHAAQRAGRAAARLDGELVAFRARAVAVAEEACEDVRRADRRCATTLASLAGSAPLTGDVAPTLPATPLALAVGVAYAPQFHFAAGERNFPMDPEAWLARADRRHDGSRLYFDPRGEAIRRGDLAKATLPFSYRVTGDGELQLEYHTFYPDNDFPDSGDHFDHEGDWERVAVQFGDDGRPEAMGFQRHGHWGAVPWRQGDGGDGLELDGLHANVFVAQGGHGAYAHAGRYENDGSDKLQTIRDVSRFVPGPAGRIGEGVGSLGDHYEDNANGKSRDHWNPGAGQVVDARSIPEMRGPGHWGENQGDGNPQSTLRQEPPRDLDAPNAPHHPEPARGIDEIGIAKDGVRIGRGIGEQALQTGDDVVDAIGDAAGELHDKAVDEAVDRLRGLAPRFP